MPRTLFGMTALFFVLIFAPLAPAMQSTPTDEAVVENLCAPVFDSEVNQESIPLALDYQQMENVRIELLERGFNPGFDSELGNASNSQLMEAVRQFQAEYDLAVTGQIDSPTLAALSIATQKPALAISEEPVRAKPSR